MKTRILIFALPLLIISGLVAYFAGENYYPETKRTLAPEDGCVFMTVMGEQSSKDFSLFKNNKNLNLSVRDGLSWLAEAQLVNGGYGAGSHTRQDVKDPHAVPADPATSAMVAMSFLRSGNTLKTGLYAENLSKTIAYLLETIENTSNESPYITAVRGTQIQRKLGENIDAVLTAQFLSNLMDRNLEGIDKKRVVRCLDICISKIEKGTDSSGKQTGAGWAGVLQSGLANSALESAQAIGATVDEDVLERSRKYQKGNYNEDSGAVKTDDGAGVMLYAVSGSVRASAKEARKAKETIAKANKDGVLDNEAVTAQN